ncbi:anthranilate synthase component I family protein [Psychroserpens sp.]|uniref:anthranilate synthase component I family protein n=1 Tax=Psychroserpens sp. TaxID=2020870 RepID=UPI001B0297E6|nr:anthranilate synthase component I family protein [Psychroserpens sp.]MBO6606078.1 anthranilate synthase component I family protein [Psychroserpens sp.]MBO6631855.1 anthranilate synthase component I family protein [Psychroserpens sp.]MBO6652551.1 anthranilate synthase component I family protein [Psychroserpens sp.]MBO6681677.1 anthranilate synthase component I family protein [Psychroserpens sp.]MBO6749452.1 anthranilate synthase component I family protein [Psychroserpens sp.]
MKTFSLYTHFKKILADTITPVSIYLKIRDKFPNSILLESSDYHANDNSFSYICFNPIASIQVDKDVIHQIFPDGSTKTNNALNISVTEEIHKFTKRYKVSSDKDFKFINNGIFGYTAYDAVKYFEDIEISKKPDSIDIPDIYYAVYQNIIAINHFKNEAYIFAHCHETENNIDEVLQIISSKNFASYSFRSNSDISSNLSDDDYKQHVELAKKHCARGDVFQLVLSKKFSRSFKGDEFNVYRALRSINPSPYLFYFDYGNFKIFGSSPEAQLVVKDGQAEIHPIAGTFRRTGNDEEDQRLAKQLAEDDKENSEHVMLVDLARNDLSRHGSEVTVDTYREAQFFSHVIHLVSKVTGNIHNGTPTIQVVADTFPAGTLSGAPKHRAMQLIEQYEKTSRAFYGGAIGFMDFQGNYNHAIMIRTFLSKNHELHWQAGAGLVSKSNPDHELQEVYNKLGALTKAIELAEEI